MYLLKSTKNTRQLLPDRLQFIRSDVPVHLTDQECQWLLDHSITTIIDLRTETERMQKPCVLEQDPAFLYISLPVNGGNAVPEAPDKVAASYIRMVDGTMDTIIDTILNAKTNVLYFCNAGKDRTGVVSAILLSKLGYGRQYIIEDYLRSGINLKGELQAFAEQNPDVDLNVITPRAEYIQGFLDWYDQSSR